MSIKKKKSLDARKAHEMYIYITLDLTKLYPVYIKKELYYIIILFYMNITRCAYLSVRCTK